MRGLTDSHKRRSVKAMLAFAFAAAWSGAVIATPIASEGFQDYSIDATGSPTTDTILHQNTGGSSFTGAWAANGVAQTELLVVSPSTPLSYAVKNASNATVGTIDGGNRALQFNNATTTGSTMSVGRSFASNSGDEIWSRVLLRFDVGVVDGSDFLAIYFGNSTNNPNYDLLGGGSGDFALRNGGSGVVSGGPDIGAGDIGGTTYLLAARLSKTTPGAASIYDKLELWVNPVLDAQNNLTTPTLSGAVTGPTSVASVGLRNNNLDAGSDVLLIDELVFGTAVGDVVPGAVGVVPEPAGAALAGAACVGVLARRRRAVAASRAGR